MRSIVRLAIIGFGLGLATTGAAQQHAEARPVRGLVLDAADADTATFRLRAAPVALDPILVAAEPGRSAASARAVRDLEIRLRPRGTAQAEQIFLRGFDADHGTDVAISVDGVPVNRVSHGRGQGYADLHFLIPEVVERVEVRKGPYDARDGNLVTAGAVDFQTRDRVDGGSVELRGGSFGTAPATAIVSVEPVTGGVRYRHVGARPADENGSVEARGHTVAELFGCWSLDRLDLIVAVDNLFDVERNEAQFATTSRLRDEASPSTELHFTPGPGRALQLAVEYRF